MSQNELTQMPMGERLFITILLLVLLLWTSFNSNCLIKVGERLEQLEKVKQEYIDSLVAENHRKMLLKYSLENIRKDIDKIKYDVYDQKILWNTIYDFLKPENIEGEYICEDSPAEVRDITDSMFLASIGINKKNYENVYFQILDVVR
jgi:hypothetical protein